MKYSSAEIFRLFRTRLGRNKLGYGAKFHLWPLFYLAAWIHRRTALRRTRIIVVVGSFGKTTAARACMAAFDLEPDRVDGRNGWSGLAQLILETRRGRDHAVYEVAIDGPGQMRRYSRLIRPDVVIVTAIGSEHHRSLLNLDTTRDEKAEMVRGLSSDGLAILNGDDPNVRWMASQTRARVMTFGRDDRNAVVLTDSQLDWPSGSTLRIRLGDAEHRLRMQLLGEPMTYSAVAAVAAATAEGIDFDTIASRLADLPPATGRLQPVKLANGAWLLRDECKSAIETVDKALDLFEQIPARRKLIVMGEISEPPGSQGPIYRRIGERMAKVASRIVLIGGNFQRYAAGARRGGLPSESIIDAGRGPVAAARIVAGMLQPGDVVLIKGRDTQRLERIVLALAGSEVGCDIPSCEAMVWCHSCPMLERGWLDRRVLT